MSDRSTSVVSPGKTTVLTWYYLVTPAFWLLDVLAGWSVRVAFLDAFPVGKHLYYALCCALGLAARRTPAYAGQLAFIESAANVGFLILSVGVWYLGVLDWAGSDSAVAPAPSTGQLVNFVLSAAVAAGSYELRSPSHQRMGAVGQATPPD